MAGKNYFKVKIETNARQLKDKYYRRANRFLSINRQPHVFVHVLFKLRQKNLEEMIYRRSPWMSMPYGRPTGDLKRGEQIEYGGAGKPFGVTNTVTYAFPRASMTGFYKIAPGVSKYAPWVTAAEKEFITLLRAKMIVEQRKMLKGQ